MNAPNPFSHQELREAIGSYVLEQLDDDALCAALIEHLAGCPDCRSEVDELGRVRNFLQVLREPASPDIAAMEPAARRPPRPAVGTPPSLDDRVERALVQERDRAGSGRTRPSTQPRSTRRSRQVSWRSGAIGVLLGAAVAAGVAVVVTPVAPVGPTVLPAAAVETVAGVEADVGVVDHTWGLELRMRMVGLAADRPYDVVVLDRAGGDHPAGQIRGVEGTVITCSMNSSLLLDDAAAFEVRDPSGAVVVDGLLPA